MKRRLFFVAFAMIVLPGHALWAGGDPTLTASSSSGTAGGTSDVLVSLAAGREEATGYEFEVCHDDTLLGVSLDGIVVGHHIHSAIFATHALELTDSGWSAVAAGAVFPLEADDVHDLYGVTYDLLGAGTAEVSFCGANVPNSVSTGTGPVTPATAAGILEISAPEFVRGDANGNGSVSALVDGIFLLTWGFLDGPAPPCLDAADANDAGGVVAITDAVFLLQWGFTSGAVPPAPGTKDCGEDPTPDGVGCEAPPACG